LQKEFEMRLAFVPLLICLTTPALGQTPREALFPSDVACYLRYYNKEHMAKHPNQRVQEIQVGPDYDQWGDDVLALRIRVSLVNNFDNYFAVAYCDPAGAGLACAMEGDAGSFQLTTARDGAIKIDLGPDGMSFEGESGFMTIEGSKGDDRSFVMPPVPADSCP
jgi:hypothetical protein